MHISTLDVVWTCGKGEDCINLKHPGQHSGDYGYLDAYRCVNGCDVPDLRYDFKELEAVPEVKPAA